MERHDGKLCISGSEFIESAENPNGIVSLANYKKLVMRSHIQVLRRACYGTPALIDWESLPLRYKQLYIARFGDPYKQMQDNYIASYIVRDAEAWLYYNDYRLDDGRSLPAERITEYVINAEILDAVSRIAADRKAMRKALSGSTKGIWETLAVQVAQLAEQVDELKNKKFPHTLPQNHVRLREKVKQFKADGYESLIHRGYCNKNTEKINDNARLWLLARWANMVNRITSFEHLFVEYNKEAGEHGWKKIESVTTIRNYLMQEDVKELWWGYRYGEGKSKEKFSLQHSTRMPSMRDSLWYSDGTKLNYFYLNEDGKIETISVYEVMDAYSEVLLGYHISKTEDYQAQYGAYKMAVQFAGHRPYQIGYDNQGGHRKLENGNFLNKLARLSIKTQPYNGKSKTIESAFGRFQASYLKKDWFFTGQNITAKANESKANMEFVLANKANLPSLEDIKQLYKQRRDEWNNAPHPKAKHGETRIQMYMNSHNPRTVKVELWDMVDLFWIEKPEPVMLTAYGLSFEDKKVKYSYLVYGDNNLPDQRFLRQNIDKKFVVKYDPDDMSLIMLYERDATGLRFVREARTKVEVARGKQEQEDFEAAYISRVNAENKVLRLESIEKMDAILEQHNMLPEQHGLRSPGARGLNKKGRKQAGIGKYTKVLSNAVDMGEDQEPDIYSLM